MATVVLHRKQLFKWALPYWVFVDGRLAGIMQLPHVELHLPDGQHTIGVKLMFGFGKWMFGIGGERVIQASGTVEHLQITDRERWWNLLFDIDLLLWVASLFLSLPTPWNYIYQAVSEGFFAIWLLRIWIIRKRYFVLEQR